MGKQGVFLENGIQLSFVWRKRGDILAVKDDPALIRGLKAADECAASWSFRIRWGREA